MSLKVTAKNITPTSVRPSEEVKKVLSGKLEALIKEETKMVKGIFRCFETPGSTTKITCRKYPGIPAFEKTMTDGFAYEVPLYVARHLNGFDAVASHINGQIGSCSYPVHGFKLPDKFSEPAPSALSFGPGGEGGIPVPIIGISRRVRRYGFQSMEFETIGSEYLKNLDDKASSIQLEFEKGKELEENDRNK